MPNSPGEVLDFLELSKLDRFYVGTMKKAVACLPKGERPVTKDAADMWMRRLAMAARNSDEAKKVVEEFDHWKKTRTFKDKEAAAKLHLIAAIILARLDLRKEAARKVQGRPGLPAARPHGAGHAPTVQPLPLRRARQAGLDARWFRDGLLHRPRQLRIDQPPRDPQAQGDQRAAERRDRHVSGQVGRRQRGGRHGPVEDQTARRQEPCPIPLMAKELRIGEDVCALGWGGAMSQNLNATFTKGVVSNLPAGDDNEDFIATDCMVNPGNSGGPLCSFCGGVAGMVTRKRQSPPGRPAIGMAIPVGRLRKFLAEKLPKDAADAARGSGQVGQHETCRPRGQDRALGRVYRECSGDSYSQTWATRTRAGVGVRIRVRVGPRRMIMAFRIKLMFLLVVGWAGVAVGQRAVTLHRVELSGTVVQIGPRAIAIRAANGEKWTLNLDPNRTKIKVTGSAEPEMLTKDTCVRFTADRQTLRQGPRQDRQAHDLHPVARRAGTDPRRRTDRPEFARKGRGGQCGGSGRRASRAGGRPRRRRCRPCRPQTADAASSRDEKAG